MGTEGVRIKIRQSNRIVNESLETIDDLFFAKQYQQADRTLAKIIRDSSVYKEGLCLDVLAFLGGRGRGKTSAMCSYFSYLNKLQKENTWSEVSRIAEKEKIRFLGLPYIDAAMLAEAEYIIDVILAEMWDEFEKYVRESNRSHEADFERLAREIKQKFIEVRKAYLLLKEREEGKKVPVEKEVPVPSALHELASGINLQQKLQSLIDDYLSIFQYERGNDCYLVIAIDDVDMSGKKAHYILEQIRRFLCMKKVVVLVTADIDRLQIACESRYKDIYADDNDRRKFINEYLEKVLPYNMRIYMPEIRERHDSIVVETAAKAELELQSDDEKNMILECMAKNCQIYFDGDRRKRHFLQNQSMRSMVNYFEQMIRMKDNCLAWLKADLKERIVERIIDTEQKSFMNELLAKDYEDVNNSIITYVWTHNRQEFGVNLDIYENSMGQALYMCRVYEDLDARNAEFVNAIILLYSIMMQQVDGGLKKSIIGGSLWGETEYELISTEAAGSPFCMSFDLVGSLELSIVTTSEREMREKGFQEMLNSIVEDNRDAIVAWLCSLLFVSIGEEEGVEYALNEEQSESFPVLGPHDFGEDEEDLEAFYGYEEHDVEADDYGVDNQSDLDDDDVLYDWTITLYPRINAKKTYLSNAFGNYQERYKELEKMLLGALKELAFWVDSMTIEQNAEQEAAKKSSRRRRGRKSEEDCINKLKKSLLDDIKEIISEKQPENDLKNQVEILYNIGKVLAQQGKTDESSTREAYRKLVSSYKTIEKELGRRDRYFNDKVKLKSETKFAKEFRNSPQAKVLLQGTSLTKAQRNLFERKLGALLIEFRNKLTVFQKPFNA